MGLKIVGSITIGIDEEEIVISGEDFSLEEDGDRKLGDGDSQYEALFICFDNESRFNESRFKVLIQVTEFEGKVSVFDPTIRGKGQIITDDLSAELC